MNKTELIARKLDDKSCFKVKWQDILIGLIHEEEANNWRISCDLKGEFWALQNYESQDLAIEALIEKKKSLDEYRLNQLSKKN